jgi:hypothetical protein
VDPAGGLLTVGGAGAESGVPEHPDFDRIDRYIREQMADCRIPGFSLAIVKDGEPLYVKGYGRADDAARAVTPDTPFLIGSGSKTITALAVKSAQLRNPLPSIPRMSCGGVSNGGTLPECRSSVTERSTESVTFKASIFISTKDNCRLKTTSSAVKAGASDSFSRISDSGMSTDL